MTDSTPEDQAAWPTHCPACGTELSSAVIDFEEGNEPRAELNPGEMAKVDYCPNPECPLKTAS